jgi:hypothetical protein
LCSDHLIRGRVHRQLRGWPRPWRAGGRGMPEGPNMLSTTSPASSRAWLARRARLRPQMESREEEEEDDLRAQVGTGAVGRTGEFRSQYWWVGEPRAAAGPATGEAPEDEGLLGRHGGGPASGGSAAGESGDRGGLRSNRCQGGVSKLRRRNCARRG